MAQAAPEVSSPEAKDEGLGRFDLTPTISAYLDLHLLFPLLDFVENNEQLKYDGADITRARLALLKPTNMADYTIEQAVRVWCFENGADPNENDPSIKLLPADEQTELQSQMDTVYANIAELEKNNKKLYDFFQDKDAVRSLVESGQLNLEYLEKNLSVDKEALDAYYHYAKFQYDCGNYSCAYEKLSDYLSVAETKTTELGYNAQWGKFAAAILMTNWDQALIEMNILKKAIEERNVSDKEKLQQRTWLLHWSLFLFFNHPKGKDMLIDTFFSERYLQAIQTNTPWLLRYLTTAVIINNRRRNELKNLLQVIQQEQYTYNDPITKFLECLYVHFDFEGAQQKLHECKLVLQSDYFLCNCADVFMENARLFIFETYCRIHHKIDIGMLAQKLAMGPEEAERWIVDLIRGAYLDAKIDSKENYVIMGSNFPSVYQQVIDKTKDLTIRSYQLAENIERSMDTPTPEPRHTSY